MTKKQMTDKAEEFATEYVLALHAEAPGAFSHEEACAIAARMGVRYVLESMEAAS